jgi:hypothetical protein
MAGQTVFFCYDRRYQFELEIFIFGLNNVIFTSFSVSDSDPKLDSFPVLDPEMVT